MPINLVASKRCVSCDLPTSFFCFKQIYNIVLTTFEYFQEAEKNKVSRKVTLRELFGNRSLRQPILIAMTIMVAQQLSGINAVMFFSTEIFKQASIKAPYSQYATLGNFIVFCFEKSGEICLKKTL